MIRDRLKEASKLQQYSFLFMLFFQVYIFYKLECMMFHNENLLGEIEKCRPVSPCVEKNPFMYSVFLKAY